MEVFYPKKTFEGVIRSEREEIVGDKLYGAMQLIFIADRSGKTNGKAWGDGVA